MAAATANKSPGSTGTKRRFRIWSMFIVLFLGWAVYTIFGQMQQKDETNQKLSTLQGQIDAAAKESGELERQIERLNDEEYIEQLATKELGMVKQGERQIFSD
ncbi:FtsB family cell division protein [Paenibacillus arenilitoris]|uniref:Septum formation initiator family protein n=1 Tax=Paenibacillus arenilitoris TaxID=2772299 RepID=A0A927H8F1_9BACL|nr:septum formation initiator family protein [Paenibacillus arenilitoris]MBD2872656.1 septum formation initiator family protein [Paenibacillus arenilitoris]